MSTIRACVAAVSMAALLSGTAAAQSSGPLEIYSEDGIDLATAVPTSQQLFADPPPGSDFIISGRMRMAVEGVTYVALHCFVYSTRGVAAEVRRTFTNLGGPFQGTFHIGLRRMAGGSPRSYACWANAYGTRNGMNWRAYEEPSSSSPTGYAQYVRMANGQLWNGAPFVSQVTLHFSGRFADPAAPSSPDRNDILNGLKIPDGSNVQWRPPIIPPLYSSQVAGIPGSGVVSFQNLGFVTPDGAVVNCGQAGCGPRGGAPRVGGTPPVDPRAAGRPQ